MIFDLDGVIADLSAAECPQVLPGVVDLARRLKRSGIASALRTIAKHAGRENATLHSVTEQALRKRLDTPSTRPRANRPIPPATRLSSRSGPATTPARATASPHPQLILRIGWPASQSTDIPSTDRRDLRSVLLHA